MKKITRFKASLYLVLFLIIVSWVIGFNNAYAAKKEDSYNTSFCAYRKGIKEYKIKDPITGKLQGRVDCLITHYAIEVDFGKKYAECIGQALFYAMFTGRTAGCALITEKNSRFIKRAEAVRDHYELPISFWTIAP